MKYALLVTLCLRGLLNAAGFSSSSIAFPQRTSLNSMNGGSYRKLVATGLLDVDPVQSGGFYKLESLASGDVKASLLDRIKSLYSDSEKIAGGKDDAVLGEIETLVSFLGSQGKGYDGDLVDGDWSLLYSRNGKKSPAIQKIIGKSEKVKKTFSNFNVKAFEFENVGYTRRSNGVLKATVEFKPVGAGFDKAASGDIVIRRISCDIVGASFKYRSLPTLPLPIRAKGGYLDFVYLDDDMRITRGNRGGLFIHVKPEFLEEMGV